MKNHQKQVSQLNLGKVSDEFQDYWKNTSRKVHGGVYAQGKRKSARPFDSKKPVHLVLRSSIAKGKLSMLSPLNQRQVEKCIHHYAKRFFIKIYRFSNNGNHLHILLKAHSRQDFQKYLRTISGLISRSVLKAKRGQAKGKFWDTLAFSRISEWGKAFRTVKNYVEQNLLEAAGIVPYKPRKYKLIALNKFSTA